MNPHKLPLLCILILSNLLLTTPVVGQQKRRNAEKPAVKAPTPALTPAPPTFETLVAADSYKIYAEVRGVGGLVRSSSVNDVLEPILKLGGPPKDFVEFVNWMKSHADQLTSSRMLIAAWPNLKDAPEFVAAIEFSSAEEAAKFETPLNGILPTVLPPVPPPAENSPSPGQKSVMRPPAVDQKPPAPIPGYSLQRQGSLLLISASPLQLKKLRPAGSKPLSEDPNFRVAYNRFASDPIFVFVDLNAIEKERQEREKQWAEQEKKYQEERQAREEKQKAEGEQQKTEADDVPEGAPDMEPPEVVKEVAAPEVKAEPAQEPSQAELTSATLNSVAYSMFTGVPVLPDAFAIGFSPEADSFDVRLLMIDAAGKTSDPIPFFSFIQLGAPIAPQSASVIPNDSELVTTMSLDFQQLYTRLQAPPRVFVVANSSPADANVPPVLPEAPLVNLEKLLKIKIKDDLLPLLGSEVALSLPLNAYNPFAPPRPPATTSAKDEAKDSKEDTPASFVAISLRDKEGMQRLMPKLVEGLAGKAAVGLAQTERREDTEIVSYAGMFSYAFVGNFIVLSNNPANVRHVVDSYLKGATLAADVQFRNYTRWQPHEVQGQIYISSAYAESYKTWANDPNARISEEARAFLERLTATTQPITYSLSNDGFGKLHELHVPKSVLLVSVAGLATMANPPAIVGKEREATSTLWSIGDAERQYKEKNATYGSLEELTAAQLVRKEALNSQNYKFEVTITAEGYSISAVPIEYGKSGKLSFFLDQTGTTRAADHGGSPASASDPPYNY